MSPSHENVPNVHSEQRCFLHTKLKISNYLIVFYSNSTEEKVGEPYIFSKVGGGRFCDTGLQVARFGVCHSGNSNPVLFLLLLLVLSIGPTSRAVSNSPIP